MDVLLCVYIYTCSCAGTQVCVCLWKKEADVKRLPLFLSILFLRQGLSLVLELPDLAAGGLTEPGAP